MKKNRLVRVVLAICFAGFLLTAFQINIFVTVAGGIGMCYLLKMAERYIEKLGENKETEETEDQK